MKKRLIFLFGVCCVLAFSVKLTAFDMTEAEEILIINAYEGDLGKVRDMINKGVDVNAKGPNDETPLLAAVNSGKIDIAAYLLAHGANIEDRNYQDSTPLIIACQYGHSQISAMLIEMGAKLTDRDYNGYDPLMIAAARGHDIVVRQLLAFGVDSSLTNKHGNTALILAMYAGHVNVVKTLLEKGNKKQLKITNKLGQTPSDFAKEIKNPAITRLLAEAASHK